MIFPTRRRRRKAALAAGFLPAWRDLLQARLRYWSTLSEPERARLEQLTLDLLVNKRWEAANGFTLTDEIRVLIAAQAAMLILGLPDDSFHHVRTILVRATTLVRTGERTVVPGIASRDPMAVVGLAEHDGQIVVAWDTVLHDARHPGNGHNVVLHEFAHQIDMWNGTVNGTPPLATQEQFDRWVEVCTRIYHQVAAGEAGPSLSSYASVNAGEFFAVATEVFFDNPHGLRNDHPDLYRVLADFYRQDPVSRVPAPTE